MELINQHTKKIMEGCKERARDAGLAFDDEGNLWWSAGSHNLIRKISPEGKSMIVAKGGNLNYPLDIVNAGDGFMYVSGAQTGEIFKVAKSGKVEVIAKVPGPGPWRIGHMVYGNGKLYASGLNSHKIYSIGSTARAGCDK